MLLPEDGEFLLLWMTVPNWWLWKNSSLCRIINEWILKLWNENSEPSNFQMIYSRFSRKCSWCEKFLQSVSIFFSFLGNRSQKLYLNIILLEISINFQYKFGQYAQEHRIFYSPKILSVLSGNFPSNSRFIRNVFRINSPCYD